MNIQSLLCQRFQDAMLAAGIPAECKPHIAISRKVGFGDYQANGAMGAAKKTGSKPRDLAEKILSELALDDIAEKTEIAGPGFINIYLKPSWLASQLFDYKPNSQNKPSGDTVVVDYSGPNLAKEMHVGHLRSTIIGDAVVRALEYQGHKVIRQNHVGDWGTQFGMLIAELENAISDGETAEHSLSDLEGFYRQAKKHFDEDKDFANTAREYVVKLQSGEPRILALWQQFRTTSLLHSEDIYQKLNVTLTKKHVKGESAYNNDLATLVEELEQQKLASEDQGARVVMLEEMTNKEGKPFGVIIQKQDGGYLYATTDLAAIRHRTKTLDASRIMYFIDARQSDHMQQVFLIARKAGFADDSIKLEHAKFGTMLGKDGKPFKTRSGDTVKLSALLDEAIDRAEQLVKEKSPELDAQEIQVIARKVGIGAVKYADLAKTRTNDYIFNWETMLSFEGNTGPYLQYAYTRIQSLFKKAQEPYESFNTTITITAGAEKSLVLKVLQLNDTIKQMTDEALPHVLCNYLYELSSLFMTFYEQCPMLKSDVEIEQRNSRLMISKKVAQALETGLDLLGIEVMPRM